MVSVSVALPLTSGLWLLVVVAVSILRGMSGGVLCCAGLRSIHVIDLVIVHLGIIDVVRFVRALNFFTKAKDVSHKFLHYGRFFLSTF